MKINIVTLFPEFFSGPLSSGLMQRAVKRGVINLRFYNPRSYTDDPRQTVDDRPYGGGPGMVMLVEPLDRTMRDIGFQPLVTKQAWETSQQAQPPLPSLQNAHPGRLLYMSPRGKRLTQDFAAELAQEEQLTILCGRYEGLDSRLLELYPIEEVSIGDFVLNGGETAALSVCEAVSRLVPGFMGHEESGTEESFSAGLLEYPHYTRPETYRGLEVPAVLRSGDHGAIARWRRDEALRVTLAKRPDVLEGALLDKHDERVLRAMPRMLRGRNLYVALLHYPVLDKEKKSTAVSLTNLDIHDIARSSCCYGLGGYYVVTPIKDQRQILDEVLHHWTKGAGAALNPDRKTALELVRSADSLQDVIRSVTERHGMEPEVISTSAQGDGTITFDEAGKILYTCPAVLVLGTSHGLAPEALAQCKHRLPPLRRLARYNHFSVRSACAILLERLLGEWG